MEYTTDQFSEKGIALPVKVAADVLGIGIQTVRELIKNDMLPAYTIESREGPQGIIPILISYDQRESRSAGGPSVVVFEADVYSYQMARSSVLEERKRANNEEIKKIQQRLVESPYATQIIELGNRMQREQGYVVRNEIAKQFGKENDNYFYKLVMVLADQMGWTSKNPNRLKWRQEQRDR